MIKRLVFASGVVVLGLASCKKKDVPQVDFAGEMRQFVIEISANAKAINPEFLIIPQNGVKLVTNSTEEDTDLAADYLAAIDGYGQENLFYGYKRDDRPTPEVETNRLLHYLRLLEDNDIEVLVTDYCKTTDYMDDSYARSLANNFIGFAAPERSLSVIPEYPETIYAENAADVTALSEAKNFLYLINKAKEYANKSQFIDAVNATNYDLIIMDRDFGGEQFTAAEIESLKHKNNGGTRLVIAYMSIGEAEDYRSYWKKEWKKKKTEPSWLYDENRKWRGNYKVFYWTPEWKAYIYGNEEAYLTSLLNLGFDGAYLDIIDAYEFYEEM